MRIEKIMCPHITLQHSGHRDFNSGWKQAQATVTRPTTLARSSRGQWHSSECPWITVKTRTSQLQPVGDSEL